MSDHAMPDEPAPQVDCDRHHASLWVRDVSAAVDFYTTRLGFRPGFTWGDPPTIAGVNLDRVQIFLERGDNGVAGGAVYFVVGDADALHDFQRERGATIVEPPGDRPYSLRDYSVRDLDGNRLTFGHYIPSAEPPLEIERVEVPVRLERRLAAVLADLARHKRMSVSGCLEETLLHTFEPLGDGVASPHTRAQLRHIQELKRRHGIEYDCHASYRFVEGASDDRGS
jgi:catechol 2,3-dioxygenase-like lactoylglutathione lyase family enzyme